MLRIFLRSPGADVNFEAQARAIRFYRLSLTAYIPSTYSSVALPFQVPKGREIDLNLCSGAGGLALGLGRAELAPTYLYELNEYGWQTSKNNRVARIDPPGWKVHKGDVSLVDWSAIENPVRLIAAGVPCQPFSRGGKHQAQYDERNLFPETLRAIQTLQPQAVLIENVHGLLRQGFRRYLHYILRSLAMPSLHQKRDELWSHHSRRLKEKQESRRYEPEYCVSYQLINAADYGVAQMRRRVFIVALRSELGEFTFPDPTHSSSALLRAQWTGAYWNRWSITRHRRIRKMDVPKDDGLLPWVTVRDVISTLPNPAMDEDNAENWDVPNHWVIPGARSYIGHSGSDPDWPSKTIKAGVHGVPGGENTLRVGSRGIRYYTLREAAAIQSFPNDYAFAGARIHVTRQIGNAVAPLLAELLGKAVFSAISDAKKPIARSNAA